MQPVQPMQPMQPGMMVAQANQHVLRQIKMMFSLGFSASSFPPFLEGRYSREEFKADIDSINDIIRSAMFIALPGEGRVSRVSAHMVLGLLFPIGLVLALQGTTIHDDEIGISLQTQVGFAMIMLHNLIQLGLGQYLNQKGEKVLQGAQPQSAARGDEITNVPEYVEAQLAPKYARFGAHIQVRALQRPNPRLVIMDHCIVVTDTAAAPPPVVAPVLGVQPMGIVQPATPLAQPLPTPPRRSFLSSLSPFSASAPPAPRDVEAPPNPLASDAAKTPTDRLLELKQIHALGLISDAEMQAKRDAILRDV